jgi:glycogen operon protein
MVSELATRLAGSSDLYGWSGRRPYASINFVTAHDGFTLQDLVSYNEKHNEGNGDDNADGESNNLSWNCGVEGPTDDPAVLALRAQQKRNFMATLLLSQGVPMICGGDELGRTQRGNNNAYCQDNPISWFAWDLDPTRAEFLEFVRHLVRLRRFQPVLRRRRFLQGRAIRGLDVKDISWFKPSGSEMDDEAWSAHFVRTFGVRLSGTELHELDDAGEPITGDTLYIAFNAHHERVRFVLPPGAPEERWERMVDTARREWRRARQLRDHTYGVAPRSVAVFRLAHAAPGGAPR